MELTDPLDIPADAGLRPIGCVDLTRLRCSTEKIAPLIATAGSPQQMPWTQLQGG